ncbi:MAG: hypothetical protein ABI696_00590 [Rubrivivax sp.]
MSSTSPPCIAIVGAQPAVRALLAQALAESLSSVTGLMCAWRAPGDTAPGTATPALLVVDLADPATLDRIGPSLVLLAPGCGDPDDCAAQEAGWRAHLMACGARWCPLPTPMATLDATLQSALDAVAPLLRALPAPRDGLFTRLAARNAAPAARAWRCERCDDPLCEQRVAGH